VLYLKSRQLSSPLTASEWSKEQTL